MMEAIWYSILARHSIHSYRTYGAIDNTAANPPEIWPEYCDDGPKRHMAKAGTPTMGGVKVITGDGGYLHYRRFRS